MASGDREATRAATFPQAAAIRQRFDADATNAQFEKLRRGDQPIGDAYRATCPPKEWGCVVEKVPFV
jgi:hypothetical protein